MEKLSSKDLNGLNDFSLFAMIPMVTDRKRQRKHYLEAEKVHIWAKAMKSTWEVIHQLQRIVMKMRNRENR
ncbi:hypothetical protein D918_09134 [Trichuris suis]|nr:hypothetical protein D918_09134 [Trichuris suis]